MKNDDLRKKLAARFDDYEAEPTPQSWETIEKAIAPKRKKRVFLIWWCLAAAVLTAGSGVIFVSKKPVIFAENQILASKEQAPTLLSSPSIKSIVSAEKENQPQKNTPEFDRNISKINPKNVQKPVENRSSDEHNPKKSVEKPIVESTPPVENVEKTVENVWKTVRKNVEIPVSQYVEPQGLAAKKTDDFDESDVLKIVKNTEGVLITPLNPLIIKPLTFSYSPHIPFISQQRESRVLPVKKSTFEFLASLNSTMSYQHIKIDPNANVAQVKNTPVFDPRRIGISAQIGGSLRLLTSQKNSDFNTHFYTNLHYSAQQQWIDYQVINPQEEPVFVINELKTRSESYVAERVGTPFSIQNWVHRFGLNAGLEQRFMVFNRQIKIAGGGLATWRADKQSLEFWTTASLGVALNKRLWLMPSIQYSLTKTPDNQGFTTIRPLNFGLGLQFGF